MTLEDFYSTEEIKEIYKTYPKYSGITKTAQRMVNIGEKYNMLTPIYRTENHAKTAHYLCLCECGKVKKVSKYGLLNSETKSCGCATNKMKAESLKAFHKDSLVGKVFGQLTVIEDTGKRYNDGSIVWRCSCTCGNDNYETSSSELNRQGHRAKVCCNNLIHRIEDLTGQHFGDLEVISLEKDSLGTSSIKWHCKCHNCGKENHIVRAQDLKSGKTKTCGCGKSFSWGASKVFDTLKENCITFISEYSFKELRSPKNAPMFFDFAILNSEKQIDYLIEYDGEGHYYYSNCPTSWNSKEKYEQTVSYDSIKNNWCKENNIPLIRIPYTHQKDICIEDLKLETTTFRVV